MKKLAIFTAIIIALFLIIPPLLPSSVGHALHAKATDMEANLYGLEQHVADIGELSVTYYDSAAADNTKPVILLLHGYSADKDVWTRFARHLTDDYRVIAPDMAGHGDTGFNPNWSYTMPAQAARMNALLNKLGIKHAHVMGNSMGGFIAAHYALRYPNQTLSAVLIDPAGVTSPKPSTMDTMVAKGKNPFEINSKEDFETFFSMTMAKPPWFPDLILNAVAEQYMDRKPELQHIFKDFYQKDMLDDSLAKIQTPVLLLWGGQDQLIHVSSVDVWRQGLPNIAVKVWDDIGHMPMMEIPTESANYVANFIKHFKASQNSKS